MNRYFAGALGGLLATVPMTLVMTKLFERLPAPQRYPLPPREITETVVKRLPSEPALHDRQLTELSLSAHFAYGAVTGALYPLLFRRPRHPLLYGGSYGLAVWAASYLGWIPLANILRPATEHPARRNVLMLIAHWVWGASTASISEAIINRAPLAQGSQDKSPPRRQQRNTPSAFSAGHTINRPAGWRKALARRPAQGKSRRSEGVYT